MTTWKWLKKINLRSKRFLVVSEQRKTAERNLVPRTIFPGFGEGNEVARNHGWGTGFSVARCLPLVPCSLLRNYTETLARQATERPTFSNNSWKNHSDKQQRGKAGSCWRSGTAGKITLIILLHQKFLQSDWLRAVVFQLNLKYLHVKITNLLRVVV